MLANEIDHVKITVWDCNGQKVNIDIQGRATAYGKAIRWLEGLI